MGRDAQHTLVSDDGITLPTQTGNIAADIQEKHRQPANLSDGLSSTAGDRSGKIIEAQGWQVDRNGNVVLVAHIPNLTPHNSMLNSSACATLGG
ncbi:MAG TPA: hypothetical protein V6D25_27750 [Leptolyngbyaceae cyanobacterium]